MKALIVRLVVVMMALNGCLSSAIAAKGFPDGQINLLAVSDNAKDRQTSEAAYGNDFNPPQSEMRGVIERFVADRGNLIRFFTIPYSSTRNQRLNQFYNEWLTTLAKLNFDTMG